MKRLLIRAGPRSLLFVAVPGARCCWLGWRACQQDLGANPDRVHHPLDRRLDLRFLLITLAVTPLRKLLGLPDLMRFRRMLGLFAFFYGMPALHHLALAGQVLRLARDVEGRRASGRSSRSASRLSCCMLPLAVTSTAGWIRRLGGKRWQLLHRLIYFSARRGRDPLLLAGEVRRAAAADVRRDRRGPAGVPRGSEGAFCGAGSILSQSDTLAIQFATPRRRLEKARQKSKGKSQKSKVLRARLSFANHGFGNGTERREGADSLDRRTFDFCLLPFDFCLAFFSYHV